MGALEFQRILCPVDLSKASEGALRAASVLAKRHDAQLTLLHVDVVPTSSIPEGLLETPPELATDLSSPADRPILDWKARAERLGAPKVQAFRSVGLPAQEIVAFAERAGSDLVVLGTHARHGLGLLIHGSVVEDVVHKAPCPVLVIGPGGAAALGDA